MFKKRTKKNTSIKTQEIKQTLEDLSHDDHDHDQIEKRTQIFDKQQEALDGSEPRKRVKLDKINIFGGSTKDRQKETDEAIHEKFQSLHYSKPNKDPTEKILAGQEAELTESELAKQKYMEQVQNTKKIKEGKVNNKYYRGANGYANYTLTQQELQNPQESYKWKHGPTRSKNSNTQNICRFDYDPSLCKDYHDTGYCVFGNSCIYLHDRSNYKTGWELEKDYEKAERQRWKKINNPDVEEDPDYIKDIQKFKPKQICEYCNQKLKTPVETTCRHIFCLKCANEMNKAKKKCIICNKKLDGIMNSAEKTLKKQGQEYEEMLKMAEKNNQVSAAKRSKYRQINSLDVFTIEQCQ